jgi:hypothetical protein
MWRLATATTIHNAPVGELVPFPGLSSGEAHQQREERSQERGIGAHAAAR